jgi:phage virion morphogenesis protein
MPGIDHLDDALTAFANTMLPSKRRKLMKRLADELKRVNQRRMAAETDPDGTKWPERKKPPRGGGSAKMMQGLRRKLKASSSADSATIGFPGRSGKIALIHQKGLLDAVSEGGPRIRYEVRELIGLAGGDLQVLERLILEGIN